MKAFEVVAQRAKPEAIMCSYNAVCECATAFSFSAFRWASAVLLTFFLCERERSLTPAA